MHTYLRLPALRLLAALAPLALAAQTTSPLPGPCPALPSYPAGGARIAIYDAANPNGICADVPAAPFSGVQAHAAHPVMVGGTPPARNAATGALIQGTGSRGIPLLMTPEGLMFHWLAGHLTEVQATVGKQAALTYTQQAAALQAQAQAAAQLAASPVATFQASVTAAEVQAAQAQAAAQAAAATATATAPAQ